jgi:hypothetical protein
MLDVLSNQPFKQHMMKRTNLFKTSSKLLLFCLITAGVQLTACSKDDDKKPEEEQKEEPKTNNTGSTTPEFTDGNGVMVAVKSESSTSTPFGPVITTIGTAVAVFYDSPGSNTFQEAGTVMAEGEKLGKQTNNSYVFTPSVNNTTGIDYSIGDVHWEVSGNGTVPTIDETITMGFPSVEPINSGNTVSMSSGYTLSSAGITNADSILFLVGDVVRTVVGGNDSYTFTSSELSTLNAGPSVVQIAAYKLTTRSTSGKDYHYVNETVVSKSVTIEN